MAGWEEAGSGGEGVRSAEHKGLGPPDEKTYLTPPVPPSNHPHTRKDDCSRQYFVSIIGPWRACCVFLAHFPATNPPQQQNSR
jgi:hypothetical protein